MSQCSYVWHLQSSSPSPPSLALRNQCTVYLELHGLLNRDSWTSVSSRKFRARFLACSSVFSIFYPSAIRTLHTNSRVHKNAVYPIATRRVIHNMSAKRLLPVQITTRHTSCYHDQPEVNIDRRERVFCMNRGHFVYATCILAVSPFLSLKSGGSAGSLRPITGPVVIFLIFFFSIYHFLSRNFNL